VKDRTSVTVDRKLLYHGPNSKHPLEISTVYFRSGYTPDDYPNDDAWKARLHIERSNAIKCPSILTHLAGSKKVQQVLAEPDNPDIISQFIENPWQAKRLEKTFTAIYPLDSSPSGEKAKKLALNPETAQKFVLKPQREGGGNNIYRRKIPDFLKSIPETHWPGYILMEIIEPPEQKNSIIRNGEIQTGGVICELGIYGVCLWKNAKETNKKGEVLVNIEAGHLLRTKGSDNEEGGVAAGFGSVDSVILVDV
jgi:glutathione synthase